MSKKRMQRSTDTTVMTFNEDDDEGDDEFR